MFENIGNMMDVIKKVQQNVQTIQCELQNERITSSSGDVVTVTVNGQQDIISIDLNAKYLNSDNQLLLQDLLAATINNALSKSRELNQTAMSKLTTELNLPNIPGLF
ncbi:YbaB/EbfC family nucleoid-associated protein [Anaerosinus massiliensis]|uniref:YbaB/EbfC family nucleoid-associated protein n=1 Tax=Massilibacillus massiliensis TaxID=1806837 RepID=UPI000DA60C2F|nr:YbaB/EbfC family nucleoid-associated protein [Massilibacillus massiliensis]